jgi:hypothetical protein
MLLISPLRPPTSTPSTRHQDDFRQLIIINSVFELISLPINHYRLLLWTNAFAFPLIPITWPLSSAFALPNANSSSDLDGSTQLLFSRRLLWTSGIHAHAKIAPNVSAAENIINTHPRPEDSGSRTSTPLIAIVGSIACTMTDASFPIAADMP